MHREVKAEGSVEHVRVIQSAIVGNKQTSVVPEVPLVVHGSLIEEVTGVVNEDLERNGDVPEKGFVGRIAIVLLRHSHKYRNLI